MTPLLVFIKVTAISRKRNIKRQDFVKNYIKSSRIYILAKRFLSSNLAEQGKYKESRTILRSQPIYKEKTQSDPEEKKTSLQIKLSLNKVKRS